MGTQLAEPRIITGRIDAVKEVGGPSFFALLVIAVRFCRYSLWRLRKADYSSHWRIRRLSR